ncbi:MAG: hypothetical protein AAGD06_29180 [Acidobacteriota bacterium]
MILIEVAAFLAVIVLAGLWIYLPEFNWEPWIALCGSIAIGTDLYRRFARRRVDMTSVPDADSDLSWLLQKAESIPLSESLPRALRYAKRTGNTELEKWSRLELYGYHEHGGVGDYGECDVEVPRYRTAAGRWYNQYDQRLDISDQPDLSFINEYRFRSGVAELEELGGREEMQNLADDDLAGLLKMELGVQVTRFCFNPIDIRRMLNVIRNQLLERLSDSASR